MLNSAITLAGNLTATPAVRYMGGGKTETSLRVLVNHRTPKDGEGTAAKPVAFDSEAWEQDAADIGDSATTGHRVIVQRHVETNASTNTNAGQRKYREVMTHVSPESLAIYRAVRCAIRAAGMTHDQVAEQPGIALNTLSPRVNDSIPFAWVEPVTIAGVTGTAVSDIAVSAVRIASDT